MASWSGQLGPHRREDIGLWGGQRGSGPWALWRGPLWDTCPRRRLGKGPSWGLIGLALDPGSAPTVDKSPSLSEKQGQQYPLS